MNENMLYPTGKRGTHIAHLNLQSINLLKLQVRKMGFHMLMFSES